MFLNHIELIKIKEDKNTLLSGIHETRSPNPKTRFPNPVIIYLYYFPPFPINKFRWICLTAVIMNEAVTFDGNIISNNNNNITLNNSAFVSEYKDEYKITHLTNFFDSEKTTLKGRVINYNIKTSYRILLEIRLTEVSTNE